MQIKVLFVCMGNICRSPSAEGAFLRLIEAEGVAEKFDVDSAGTHGYHIGDLADKRSHQFALKRGLDLSAHRARKVQPDDFIYYHYILAMDTENYENLLAIAPTEHMGKVKMFLEYAPHMGERDVPDPYYGGDKGFERVLDLVEEASKGLLTHIRQKHFGQ